MTHGYQKGDKPKMKKPIDLGLSSQSYVEGGTGKKLRGGAKPGARPSVTKESVGSDRGTFPSQ